MQKEQESIYFVTGNSITAVTKPPSVETYRKRGYEVIYMLDPINEYAIQQLKEYDGRRFIKCMKEGHDLQDLEEKSK